MIQLRHQRGKNGFERHFKRWKKIKDGATELGDCLSLRDWIDSGHPVWNNSSDSTGLLLSQSAQDTLKTASIGL